MEAEDQKVTLALGGTGNFKHVEINDFVISLRSFQGGIERSRYTGCVSPAYTVLRPRETIEPEFWKFVLKSEGYIRALQSETSGIRDGKNISFEQFGQIPLPFPPVAEQIAIADFLDRETSKIDALVAEQESLIALLKEKRQAVISQAVTKGLNADAPMKPSGIEWLGDVPAHWRITPLKWLTDPNRPIMYGIVLPGPDVGEGIPILKGGNVKPSRMNLQSMAKTTKEIEAPFARARLKAGDLVYSIRGSIGDCEIVPEELEGSNITQDVARVAIESPNFAPWARWALLASAVREGLASGSLGAAVRGVNIFDLKRASIPTPPPREQAEIAHLLDIATSAIDDLVAEAHRARELLSERRSGLTSAAVTGQIDVRGAV
jgi:type I restriction enzyme S subunit